MKSISLVLTGMVLTGAALGADVAPPSTPPHEPWIGLFQRYAAQPGAQPEGNRQRMALDAKRLQLDEVLRALPAPADWAKLQQTLGAAVTLMPAGQQLERARLQGGNWLLLYLTGDRATLQAEVTGALTAAGTDENNPRVAALRELQASLVPPDTTAGALPAKQVEGFEKELAMLEPVDDATVKKAVGGEENFTRLKHIGVMIRELRARAEVIDQEYQATKDEKVAQKKSEVLQAEYEEKMKADQEALTPYLENPAVAHYISQLLQEENPEGPDHYVASLTVPDLVPVLGPERAAALVRRALRVPVKLDFPFEGPMSDATRKLVREVVIAEMPNLKEPSWGLVNDEHSGALFEAMHKKFPAAPARDYAYHSASGYYLAGLVEQGRTDEAVTFATGLRAAGSEREAIDLPYEVMERLERTHGETLWKFLHAWLLANPGADEWDRFSRLSVLLGRRDELKAMVKTMADNGAFEGLDRVKVQEMQADAEMATGDFAKAAERLRANMTTAIGTKNEWSLQFRAADRLLPLADLQGDAAGYTSTLSAIEASLARIHAKDPRQAVSDAGSLVTSLNNLGRYADARRIGYAALDWAAGLAKPPAGGKNAEANPEVDSGIQSAAVSMDLPAELLRAEVELGHWPEARALLADNPWWEAADISGLLNRTYSCRGGKPVGYYVARAVQSGGDLAQTRRILEQQLAVRPAADSVYETYLAVAGAEAMPLLDKLAASDRYEERPLIWKARLQMDAHQWDAAIATLQSAITIDPSDGEQGRGDRMRVYAFMSLALAAKGDAEKSAFFANVVKAIRLSETADRWYEIGAYAKAIDLYRDALGFFQDAYCIQSRLAIRLADAGKMDEAVEHYRRAFELMPDSFGRVESHCFGCEHVFAGEKSQGVANEVFARMLKARPDKPQLYYLSGYLREEQDRNAEAAELYRHAVQLDPLYLNAWNRLADLDGKVPFTPAQRDDLLLKLAELDPTQRHVSPDLQKVGDLPRLWRTLEENDRVLNALPKRTELGELRASAAQLALEKRPFASLESHREQKDFAAVVMEHPFVRSLQSYLAQLQLPAEAEAAQPAPAPDGTPAPAPKTTQ